MSDALRIFAAFLIGSCLALHAQALTLKALKTHVVRFDKNGVTLPAEDRQAIAAFAESLRAADWCPLVAVIGLATFPAKGTDTNASATLRASYVADLLKLNGIPAEVLFFFAQPSPKPSNSVEIEAVGSPPHQGCDYPETGQGFRPSPPSPRT